MSFLTFLIKLRYFKLH